MSLFRSNAGPRCTECGQRTVIQDPPRTTYMAVLQDLWGVLFCGDACAHAWVRHEGWKGRPRRVFVTTRSARRIDPVFVAEALGACMIDPVSSRCCELGTRCCVINHRVA